MKCSVALAGRVHGSASSAVGGHRAGVKRAWAVCSLSLAGSARTWRYAELSATVEANVIPLPLAPGALAVIYVQVSAAISLDGYLDDNSRDRLILSSEEDFRDVHASRALADAILIGAGTVRKDDPSLLLRDPVLVAARTARGQAGQPTRVTVTGSGVLDPASRFFAGDARRIVLCPEPVADDLQLRLGHLAEVRGLGAIDPGAILGALEGCGVQRLFIEGGTSVLTQFLSTGTFHALRLAVAPFFVGDERAPRLVQAVPFLHNKARRLRTTRVRLLGDTTVIDMENQEAPNGPAAQ